MTSTSLPDGEVAPVPVVVDDELAGRRFGAHLRTLRRLRGLTLVQLAAATGLSHPFLSQLERGLAQPSMSTLRRLAVALGTSPIELVAAGEADPADGGARIDLVPAAPADGAIADFAEGEGRMLAHGDRPFRPIEYRGENAEPGEVFRHAEDEFLHVLEGVLVLELDGEVRELGVGDSAYFAGGVDHRWWSERGPYRLLIVKQRPSLPAPVAR
ncbi:helix-turn-helix domain-containing protein [Agromyces seonyuensis]|uniref:Helix-turn-helix domain-containing protein n=1 Tax=Agromyces seonyuensis TaxID=2662446 RepID=A0A6I4NTE6_9MICO|nr:helix-turn-helix domain-containing protein [Agromyces seonyuensis]MWB97510.1 helix-turn-helix domain-containing protein [Agromyces seonyuensis]